MPNKVLVLFSGGLDSTAVALKHLEMGDQVELHTFCNGAQKWLDLAKIKADFIINQYPDYCSWVLCDCTYLFHEIAIKNLEKDIKEFGNLVCCGCKLAMLGEAIILCKHKNLKGISDGFNREQIYYPEQTPNFIKATKDFCLLYELDYEHPLYDEDRNSFMDLHLKHNVPPSPIQPYCIFERNPVLDKSHIEEYTKRKLDILKTYIDKYL